jgi:DNA repair protein SbcC/Rad50
MIPTKLKLHNFTTYGSNTPELDLHPLKLVVLTGNNGAGKSSVLDAITWSIWGWSRAGDNADRLVRIGEKEMSVEFSFILHDTEFRILRMRKLGGSGSTALHFFAGKNNLTEGTIKATQQKIIDTLHLTYETFINSSYLRQGHADEFTMKGPSDRKKILADILGLSAYELLEEKAKLSAKEAVDQTRLLDVQISELESETANSFKHVEDKSRTEIDLKEVQVQLSLAEKSMSELVARKEKYTAIVEIEREKEGRLAQVRRDLLEVDKVLGEKRSDLKRLKELIEEKDAVEAGYSELMSARKDLDQLEDVRTKLIKSKDEALKLELAVNDERLKNERELQKIKSEASQLKGELENYKSDLEKTKSGVSKCPVCGQELDSEVRMKVARDLEEKVVRGEQMLLDLRINFKKLDSFVSSNKDSLDAKRREVEILGYKASPVDELRTKVMRMSLFEDKKRDLDVASATEKQIKLSGIRLKEQADRLKKEIERAGEVNLFRLEAELADLSREAQARDVEVRRLRSEETDKKEVLAATKQLISRSAQMEETLGKKREARLIAEQNKNDYEDLMQAFGKKGIQAMLIEAAIPEIEEETNLLLDKLTDGRMKVELVTQRETKTSGIAETLDIQISDELGTRQYEMYSGGEAFRINIALRLALSRLLTRRAGSRLQFLIIDEGFGTQDIQGKDKVVDAINIIAEDFEKILIVTHDSELKESFPQRVEVIREGNGSRFEVFS